MRNWLVATFVGLVIAISLALVFSNGPRATKKPAASSGGQEDELQEMKRELSRLQSRVAWSEKLALEARRGSDGPSEASAEPEGGVADQLEDDGASESDDELPYQELVKRETEYFKMYFEELDAAMVEQGHDPSLTRDIQEATAKAVASGKLSELKSVSCSSQICRAEADAQASDEVAELVMRMSSATKPLLQRATAHFSQEDGNIVAYFSTAGHRLPKSSVSYGKYVEGRGEPAERQQ